MSRILTVNDMTISTVPHQPVLYGIVVRQKPVLSKMLDSLLVIYQMAIKLL